MLVSIVAVAIFTFFPTFYIEISSGEGLAKAKSVINFSVASVKATDTVSVLGESVASKQSITLADAFGRLEVYTTDEYCAADMSGLVDSMNVIFVASIALIVLYILALFLVMPTEYRTKPFICPYWLTVHCLLVSLVPIIVFGTYDTTKIQELSFAVTISFSPFLIIMICISVIASIVYFYTKTKCKTV